MTRIQQVLFKMESGYVGHPYFVSGHALYQAVARRVGEATRRGLCVSHGVFVPGEHGAYPDEHSQSGGASYMGTSLRPVETYDDLFLFRDSAQPWLLDDRPRDAHNTHPVRVHGRECGDRLAFGSSRRFGLPAERTQSHRTVNWYVQCYLHGDGSGGDAVVPVSEDVLDGVRVGGARNYGFGELSVQETQVVDLVELDWSRIAAADEHVLEVVSPYVLRSEYPGADGQDVPWWWAPVEDYEAAQQGFDAGLRRREERLVDGEDVYDLDVVDHGQVVRYAGSDAVGTARSGVLRVGTHSRFGFGELRVRPRSDYAAVSGEDCRGDAASRRGDS